MTGLTELSLVEASLREDADMYLAYSYSYPHKSSYGPVDPPVPLKALWQAEERRGLFLYFHLPFCEMRCGFCNLFARAGAEPDLVDDYLATLERQARILAAATQGQRTIARLALGGGTPTFLTAPQLALLFDIAERHFDASPAWLPTSVETSPQTATVERLQVLKDRGIERVSIGVQSFVDAETHAIGRPQSLRDVHTALERLRAFPLLNIDLIYGLPGQTHASWMASLQQALAYVPEEIYLYPLYVRPRTGIGRRGDVRRLPPPLMRLLHRAARELLLAHGYEQVSMRFFRLPQRSDSTAPVYCCQTDGMVGLGCGARSYTSCLHYASRFAVENAGVQAILNQWIGQNDEELAVCDWGIRLSPDDRRRRFVIQSLLTRDGLQETDYLAMFGDSPASAFPLLAEMEERGLTKLENGCWTLTPEGLELSDAIGPALYSASAWTALEEFADI